MIMFDSNVSRDGRSKKMTRRVFLGAGTAAAAGLAVLQMRHSAAVVMAGTAVHGQKGEVVIVNFGDDGKNLGKEAVQKVVKSDAEWQQQLGSNSYNIARRADTEMPFTGVSWKEHGKGLFRCICCDTALFSSETKFESGTGWPSFWAPIAKENIVVKSDASLGMERTEVECARCNAHLGHVFDDGPKPTGLRYCMNSASMKFVKA
jgi:peptide-methionine (R)-S-oxide reductase